MIQNVVSLGFFDYVKLQQSAYIVLSDTETISEESAMMQFRADSIRTSTERPEAIDAGVIFLVGISKNQILNSIEIEKGLFDEYAVDKSLITVRADFKYNVPLYEEMLKEQKEWMEGHNDLYSYY